MDDQDRKYFMGVYKDRLDSAKILAKPSMKGTKKSISEKYSDQAHFIYELLQNADDTLATQAKFKLENDRLIYIHNGKRHFSVSCVENEEEDTAEGHLGDINAITSLGNSNKTKASIGKFGVGFKAVFQYTETPYIYDPKFCFKIEQFIVPVLLDNDYDGRNADETIFVFPFNNPKISKERAYEDISNKLQSLEFPLLFLSNLQKVTFDIGDESGYYSKDIKDSIIFGDILAERITLTKSIGESKEEKELWLFNRVDDDNYKLSVGFFLNEKGEIVPSDYPAFCFFLTKEHTDLKFIVQAPFLLNDSREGILAGEEHNKRMIEELAQLAADSIECFPNIGYISGKRIFDDKFLDILPYNGSRLYVYLDKNKISFYPFYETIKEKLKEAAIWPTGTGYVAAKNAYWAEAPEYTKIFSDEQLQAITENKNAHWVLRSTSGNTVPKDLRGYIEGIFGFRVSDEDIINGQKAYIYQFEEKICKKINAISSAFIEKQSIVWLHRFYKWIFDGQKRTRLISDKEIFLNQNNEAVAAFDKKGEPILFLPVNDFQSSIYNFFNPELLRIKTTKKFIDFLGIKEPSTKDYIYNIILPLYEKADTQVDTAGHFKLFFRYYCECTSEEADKFIEILRDIPLFVAYDEDSICNERCKAEELYLPTEELKAYFETKQTTRFIALDIYESVIDPENKNLLLKFLYKLGVNKAIIVNEVLLMREDPLPYLHSTRPKEYREQEIDGCVEILTYIVEHNDVEKSFVLWNALLTILAENTVTDIKFGVCEYFYRKAQKETYVSTLVQLLRGSKWIVDKNNEFVAPKDVTIEDISDKYNTDENYSDMVELLDFQEVIQATDENENLTEEQKNKIAMADKLEEAGIDEEELEELLKMKKLMDSKKKLKETSSSEQQISANEKVETVTFVDTVNNANNDDVVDPEIVLEEITKAKGEAEVKSSTAHKDKLSTYEAKIFKDIVKCSVEHRANKTTRTAVEKSIRNYEDLDEDEYTPALVDYKEKIELAKQKSAMEIEKIAYLEEMRNKAIDAPIYSFEWFKTLLELECVYSADFNMGSKEVSISFSVVEREEGTKRTLVLKHPDRYIPMFMEDLSDIPLVLHLKDRNKTIPIEVANIKSYTLRVKMKNSADIEDIDLSEVLEATIDAKSPAFLLEELRNRFNLLEYADDYDLQANLCENIEFVFGPPGTGKTTHLARNVLIPLMKYNSNCKVLVLTPTNKAADVLVKRIMDTYGDEKSYEEWLVRFGITGDESIEESPVFKDRTFDIATLERNVTVTTIARFPYDYFMSNGKRTYLEGMKWDYIIIDEASMIPLVNIVYPLYKKTPKKFIISGDPFQIEPITSIDLWKNENIYSMVHLDSFVNPQTVPYAYKIENLTTQYRSVPAIGNIFSKFAYNGILQHYRDQNSQKTINTGDKLDFSSLNIIKFPVSRYESIYRAKRLHHSSSYQIYSALFVFEYVVFLAKVIAENNIGKQYSIGIIAPYRAQADMLDKLIASEKLPPEISVQVGTIHGFQGDECDIIFAVLNPPPKISPSKDMFLNKRNILNVSISRAKDYLFIVMPDDDTEGLENLFLVNKIANLIKDTDDWQEFASPVLEQKILGDDKYLENNTFSTSHQNVNVYGLPEKCYEVRTEDSAVDIQIHR